MEVDLSRMDATDQANLVRAGQISPLELVDSAIDRITALNPALNAVIWERF
jgi:amidase